ncbi:AMT1-1, partial [Symbiodinium sp. CCMP2456]
MGLSVSCGWAPGWGASMGPAFPPTSSHLRRRPSSSDCSCYGGVGLASTAGAPLEFGITKTKWLVATRAGVATLNATAGGGFAALFYTKAKSRGVLISPEEIANGLLGALVAITATCACVHPYEAVIVGFVGSISALACNDLFEYRLQIDDPVGAVGVHGASGIWGLIAVGLFADGSLPGIEVDDGLFRGGSPRLLAVQLLCAVSIIGWSLAVVTPFFYLLGVAFSGSWRRPRRGLRVDPQDEIAGIDRSYHERVSWQ